MPHLALYTFGTLKAPLSDPAPLVREFIDGAGGVYDQISGHPGYLGHAEAVDPAPGGHFDLDWGAWGEFAVPTWYEGGRTAQTIALATTLSLWTAAQPAFEAIYTGLHRTALNRRHDWFARTGHPSHVCWWVAEGAVPTWQEGTAKLEHLHAHGPTPAAFTFHRSFDRADLT
ncbi:hypothetical protein CFP65_0262 [Kitasatospora sp. MMS16-BH015]|uniref:DUF3291 domain-containing protein n=1 Tax=Kitasatospora sp. MMS16-BH015 TaxID=2018025 RepID=UPI000CA3E229|nr:DUF3291 domain-containing protein [Kitasatospora sp. MMS16-BH015]AUG75241.1 hypothetical protein CFP65_0262 [Kitasatospora sp. MMS16-BH015]